jgi:ABC-type multidrug transport system fused ATPase/permease subunit
MNITSTPTLITASLFFAIILQELMTANYKNAPILAIVGLFFSILMAYLCDNGLCGIAWVLLALVPIFFITLDILRRREMAKGSRKQWSQIRD